jgi:SsrA-binding protein
MPVKRGVKPIAQNKKARHDYFIEDVLECGIELCGTEVKSLRKGACNLKDSYAQVKNDELFVIGMHISPYEQGNIYNRDPFRTRKLLAHKSEIRRLGAAQMRDGMSLVPLSLYLKDGRVKLELAVAKGKKLYDKRHSIAERDAGREMDRRIKEDRA